MKYLNKNGKTISVCIIAFLAALLLFVTFYKTNMTTVVKHIPDYSTAKIVGDYLNEDDLINAPYILEGEVVEISDSYDYGGIPFVEITFSIQDVLYSETELDDTITILREMEMFTPLEEGNEYILYLYDYEGPIATNVKMICGGNLGAYEISESDIFSNDKKLDDYKKEIKNALN